MVLNFLLKAGADEIFGHYLETKAQLEREGLLPIPS
jgi:hypothetical protein